LNTELIIEFQLSNATSNELVYDTENGRDIFGQEATRKKRTYANNEKIAHDDDEPFPCPFETPL
jgi:hypothetical protein